MANSSENENSVILNDNQIYKKEKIIAVAGNPNVGKSTVFNALTGLKQHTGNWPGKTVSNAKGSYNYKNQKFTLIDLPGTYSLMASSVEEEIARNYICFEKPDAVAIVVDATCLERNLNLVLQILEITHDVVVCVNLLDEAKKKKINIDLDELSIQLGVPVVGTSARSGQGLENLMEEIYKVSLGQEKTYKIKQEYGEKIEKEISQLEPIVQRLVNEKLNARWICLKLLDMDESFNKELNKFLGFDILEDKELKLYLSNVYKNLYALKMKNEEIRDEIVLSLVERAEGIYKKCVFLGNKRYDEKDRKLDKILTSKSTGIPIMILLLFVIFWITISGANYPSEIISNILFGFQDTVMDFCRQLNIPSWIYGSLILGVYRTVAWVVSVMLPPMAIFFPLFTLLEDSGYLPRIAFNLDHYFKKANAHGKQSLTMCMGFGCNACGVIGCRIIDSPRERLIATLTNNFVPCNGRFPTLIAIITMFFAFEVSVAYQSFVSTLMLVGIIIFGVLTTLLVSKLLSMTLLKGIPSSFALELPPYRTPQVGKVIVRSIFDRTLFVLGRAIVVAAPAGLVIWLMSNIMIGDTSILNHCSNFLDPFARLIGLDGVILMAFILGFPANEIVIPIIIMTYMCTGSLAEFSTYDELRTLLVNNGWTWVTALCTMVFSLLHFPCGTTCLTIKSETKSLKWTLMSMVIPTAMGIIICFIIANVSKLVFSF